MIKKSTAISSLFSTQKYMTASLITALFMANGAYAQTEPKPVNVPLGNSSNTSPTTGTTSAPIGVTVPFGSSANPVPVPLTPFIPQSGAEAIKAGLDAQKSRNWYELRRLMTVSQDTYTKEALLWMLVSDSTSDSGFRDFERAFKEIKDYPGMRDVRARVELRINSYGLSPQQRIDFLKRPDFGTIDSSPITGDGLMSLGQALIENGKPDEARKYISKAWRTEKFDSKTQQAYLDKFKDYLTTDDFDKRVDLLLWTDRTTQARALFQYLSPNALQSAKTRLGIANDDGAILSGAALDDRGILYESVVKLRKAKRETEALNLLLRIDSRGLPEPAQEDIWKERRILLIEALKNKRYNDAYKISSQHGLSSGAKFADGEFLAGWIALRFLNNPKQAITHFTNLERGVETGMSKSRAYYWLGRAYEADGDKRDANNNLEKAANYPTFYYGQLAAARLGQQAGQKAILNLPPEKRASADDIRRLNNHPMMQIARVLSNMNERSLFVRFAFALDDTLTTNGEHQALSEFARSQGENLIGIRVAKAGLNRGILATEAAFPFINIPRISGYHQAEDAFTLAITRQESEFNAAARSSAGALGLMQFLPSTASGQARKMGLAHQTSWLTSRPEHNLTLGSAHLADLIERFNGSYVMTIISYNAGPGRAIQWVDTYGEIRGVDADTAIDWVEMIPFSETRNYVQRVLENIQVYRARLNKDSAPINIIDDLTRGTKPAPSFLVKVMDGALDESAPEPKDTPGDGY